MFGSKWSIAALKSKGEVYECITRITGSLTRKLEQRKPSKAPCKPNFGSDVSLICIITIILIIVIVIIILEDLNFFLFVPLEGRRPSAAPNTCTAAKAIHPNSLHICKCFCLVSLRVIYLCLYLRCNAAKERWESRIFKHWFIRMHFASSYIFTQSLQSLQRNTFATLLCTGPQVLA